MTFSLPETNPTYKDVLEAIWDLEDLHRNLIRRLELVMESKHPQAHA